MIYVPRMDGTCAPGRGRRPRDIGAALASWDRAARASRRAAHGRSRSVGNAYRSANAVVRQRLAYSYSRSPAQRFEELQDLCAAAGDKASVAIATMGLLGERIMTNRLAEVSRLANEYMTLIESIGDPDVDGRACPHTHGGQNSDWRDGRGAAMVRQASSIWPRVIEPSEASSLRSPLASAYAMRCTARWWLGQAGWREDFNRALVMARDADPMSQATVVTYTYANAITCGVIAADDAALREIDEALQSAERSADDLALGLALYTKANALRKHDSAHQERALDLLRQLRERTVDGRFYPWLVPVVDVCFAEEMMKREDCGEVPLPRASVDELYRLWPAGVRNLGHQRLGGSSAERRHRQRYSGGRGRARTRVWPACARRIGLPRPHSIEIEGSAGSRPRRRGDLSGLRRLATATWRHRLAS